MSPIAGVGGTVPRPGLPGRPRRWPAIGLPWGIVVVALGTAVVVGGLAAGMPLLVIAGAAAAVLAVMIAARPDVATLTVLFILYSNAAVVAVRFHDVPFFLGAAVPLLLVIPLAERLIVRREPVAVHPALPVLVALFGVQILSTITAADVSSAFNELTSYAIEGLGIYVLLTNVIRSEEILRRATWVLLAAGVMMAGLSIWQDATGTFGNNYLGFAQMSDAAFRTGAATLRGDVLQPRLAGPVGEVNRYAQVLLMLVPLGTFAARGADRSFVRLAAVAATGIIALGVALTFSRGAAVGFAVLLAAMVLLRYVRLSQLLVIGAVVVVVLLVVPEYAVRLATLDDVAGAVSSGTAATADSAVQSRITEMLAAALVFVDHPVLGVGPGQFPAYYRDYADLVGLLVKAASRQAHNLYLGILAEWGIVGFTLFMTAVGVTVRELVRARRRSLAARPGLAGLATGYLLALIVYLATGVFLHYSFIRYFWVIMALAGVVTLLSRRSENEVAATAVAAAAVGARLQLP